MLEIGENKSSEAIKMGCYFLFNFLCVHLTSFSYNLMKWNTLSLQLSL